MAQMRPALLAIRHECSYLSPAPRRAWATASRMYKHCRAASVQPLALIVAPLVQIPILVYSVVSIRRMTQPGSPYEAELKQGGPTVHRDLTKPDSSWALPLASVAFLLANLQLSMPSSASTLFVTVRNLWQAIALVAIPVFAELPAGVFACWIPNSAFSLAQHSVLRLLRSVTLAVADGGAVTAARRTRADAAVGGGFPVAIRDAKKATFPSIRDNGHRAAITSSLASASTLMPRKVGKKPDEVTPPATTSPDDMMTLIAKSKSLLNEGNPAQAVDLLWQAIQTCEVTASGPLRFQLALALAVQGQYRPAQELLKQVLELEPSFVEAHLCLADVYHSQGDYEKADETLSIAAELRPEIKDWVLRQRTFIAVGSSDSTIAPTAKRGGGEFGDHRGLPKAKDDGT